MAVAQKRHDLLNLLLSLTPDEAEGVQRVLINNLYNVDVERIEETLLQVVHLCVTFDHNEHQLLLRKFMLNLASRSFYLAIRLSWVVDTILPTFLSHSSILFGSGLTEGQH